MNKLLVILSLVLTFPAAALNVTFINPSMQGNDFWDQVNEVALAAAKDLNISFEVVQSDGHRLLQKQVIKQIISQETKPDYIIFLPYDGTAFETFTKLEQAQIPFITIERTVFPDLQNKLGVPQQYFKFWLGEIYHDNKKAGRLLASTLFKASKQSLAASDELNVVGISGDMSGHSSDRNSGLISELEQDTDFALAQIVNARWERGIAGDMFIGLLRRYQNIQIVWTASDIMALGVADVASKQGKFINQNVFIGGFDWNIEALQAIKENRYTASVGGHFMQTAWALVKIYDHANNKSAFNTDDNIPSYELQLIDRNNIEEYQVLLNPPDWDKVDFIQFSLTHQDNITSYQFDFSRVLGELNK